MQPLVILAVLTSVAVCTNAFTIRRSSQPHSRTRRRLTAEEYTMLNFFHPHLKESVNNQQSYHLFSAVSDDTSSNEDVATTDAMSPKVTDSTLLPEETTAYDGTSFHDSTSTTYDATSTICDSSSPSTVYDTTSTVYETPSTVYETTPTFYDTTPIYDTTVIYDTASTQDMTFSDSEPEHLYVTGGTSINATITYFLVF